MVAPTRSHRAAEKEGSHLMARLIGIITTLSLAAVAVAPLAQAGGKFGP